MEADVHMHTLASGHAYGTIREMAQAAADKGMKMIGVSEHGPGIPGTCDPIYFHNLEVIPKTLCGVRILHGCEANILEDGSLSLDDWHCGQLDYLIAGIHGPCYKDQGIEKNTNNVISVMQIEKVRFISHPDDGSFPLDYPRLVWAAKENNVALEVNNSSIEHGYRLNCVENYKTMLALCQEYRVPVIINSDAHDPSWVGKTEKAEQLVLECGLDPDLILSRNAALLERFLKDRKTRAV